MTNRVMDVVYLVAFTRFPQVKTKVEDGEILLKSLKDLSCDMTLKYLTS